jgi:structural hemagglutinin/hemolysin toxin protein RtxA
MNRTTKLFQIYFYVPSTHKEVVKESMFAAGAGTIGKYQRCAFETAGRGQFEPMEGSHPFVGQKGVLEIAEEIKVEMVCTEQNLTAAIKAMKDKHPYEEVAFGYFPINSYT